MNPTTRRTPAPLVILLGLAVAVLLLLVAVLVAVVVTRGDDHASAAPPATGQALTAGGIVDQLERHGVVKPSTCAPEKGAAPATSQSRCDLGDGAELIVMAFADGSGVRTRLDGWIGGGTLIQGPNWLVNVGDLDTESQEAVRALLGGSLVNLPE